MTPQTYATFLIQFRTLGSSKILPVEIWGFQQRQLQEQVRSLEQLRTKFSAESLRQDIDARIMIKDLATKADLARGLKTIPFGLSKDEVAQMIELATSNFLRTLQGRNIKKMS